MCNIYKLSGQPQIIQFRVGQEIKKHDTLFYFFVGYRLLSLLAFFQTRKNECLTLGYTIDHNMFTLILLVDYNQSNVLLSQPGHGGALGFY